MNEPTDRPAGQESAVARTLARWRERARARWQQHGQPLVAATRDRLFGATVDPREELNRERIIRVSEGHIRRLLQKQLEKSRRIAAGELHLEQGAIRVEVTLKRWRPVEAKVRFALVAGVQDDDTVEVGLLRLAPTELSSRHWLMRWLVRFYQWRRARAGAPDLFDRLLLRRPGARAEGPVIFVPVPRAPLTEQMGTSRVLRRIAAYATISSFTLKPGVLEVGFHLGRLADRMADMYVLRHILRDAAPPDGGAE